MEIKHGDCLEIMPTLDANSIDTIITDPPYGISMMGKNWDYGVPGVQFWIEALRVAKPGALLLAFGGTRTFHRLACAIEDAGWEIKDTIAWIHAQGYPKSLNISVAIDRKLGAQREIIGKYQRPDGSGERTNEASGTSMFGVGGDQYITAPSTPEAQLWSGWKSALKPAFEPIIVAMKPIDLNFANSALKWGVAGFNIDGSRIETNGEFTGRQSNSIGNLQAEGWRTRTLNSNGHPAGRYPANVIHDGSDEVISLFPATNKNSSAARFFKQCSITEEDLCNANIAELNLNQPSELDDFAQRDVATLDNQEENATPTESSPAMPDYTGTYKECIQHQNHALCVENQESTDIIPTITNHSKLSGFASPVTTKSIPATEKIERSRFLYCAKASTAERNAGCEALEDKVGGMSNGAQIHGEGYDKGQDIGLNRVIARKNHHLTVKPIALMRYLCRLTATPITGSIILDPFMGSGSTGCAAMLEGRDFIGIEQSAEYVEIAKARIAYWQEQAHIQSETQNTQLKLMDE